MKIIRTNISKARLVLGTLFFLLIATACKKTSAGSTLSLANVTDTIPAAGGTVALNFTSNAPWSIDTAGIGWLTVSQISGNTGTASISFTAPANLTGASLSVVLNVSLTNGQSRNITVVQAPMIFPSYNTSPIAPDATGMGSTATQLLANIKLGWNIWNTLEAPGGETGWGNPVVTQALIDLVKQSGVNAIRIPCAWNFHANQTTAKIDTAWLSRVKQVVQYCFNDGLYVVLNIHWDGGWLDCTATGANQDTIKAKQKAFWEQIATEMRDFDEHLMFASSNEPNATDLPTSTVLKEYHQIFINAVRSTGGKNAYRTLVIQAPSTSVNLVDYFFGVPGMPTDQVANKLVMEVHWYTPANFCILSSDASWGLEWRFWGQNYHSTDDPTRNSTPGTEEPYMDSTLSFVNNSYINAKNGIPFLIGEFDAPNHALNIIGNPADSILSLNSRAHFYRYLVQQSKANGIAPFLWAGDIYNRANNTISDQQALDSLRTGAGL